MIGYSKEILYHFSCDKCGGWWTIGDFQNFDFELYCPHCNHKSKPEKINKDDLPTIALKETLNVFGDDVFQQLKNVHKVIDKYHYMIDNKDYVRMLAWLIPFYDSKYIYKLANNFDQETLDILANRSEYRATNKYVQFVELCEWLSEIRTSTMTRSTPINAIREQVKKYKNLFSCSNFREIFDEVESFLV